MDGIKTTFTVAYEGDDISVTVTETENAEDTILIAEIAGHAPFEIFLSEEDMWVTNDETDIDEDLIFLIGDEFESLQP